MVTSGASTRPTVRRPFSKRSSVLGELLLAEAAVGRLPQERLVDVGPGAFVRCAGHRGSEIGCGPALTYPISTTAFVCGVSCSGCAGGDRPRRRGSRSRPAGRRTGRRRSRSAASRRRARAGSATGCCSGTARRGCRSRAGRGRRSGTACSGPGGRRARRWPVAARRPPRRASVVPSVARRAVAAPRTCSESRSGPTASDRVEAEVLAGADVADQPALVGAHQVRVPHADRRHPRRRERQPSGVEHVGAAGDVGGGLGQRRGDLVLRPPLVEVAPRAGGDQPAVVRRGPGGRRGRRTHRVGRVGGRTGRRGARARTTPGRATTPTRARSRTHRGRRWSRRAGTRCLRGTASRRRG